jgi:hypothetical protein
MLHPGQACRTVLRCPQDGRSERRSAPGELRALSPITRSATEPKYVTVDTPVRRGRRIRSTAIPTAPVRFLHRRHVVLVQDSDPSPAAVFARADPDEHGRVAVAHRLVVAVLEGLEARAAPSRVASPPPRTVPSPAAPAGRTTRSRWLSPLQRTHCSGRVGVRPPARADRIGQPGRPPYEVTDAGVDISGYGGRMEFLKLIWSAARRAALPTMVLQVGALDQQEKLTYPCRIPLTSFAVPNAKTFLGTGKPNGECACHS